MPPGAANPPRPLAKERLPAELRPRENDPARLEPRRLDAIAVPREDRPLDVEPGWVRVIFDAEEPRALERVGLPWARLRVSELPTLRVALLAGTADRCREIPPEEEPFGRLSPAVAFEWGASPVGGVRTRGAVLDRFGASALLRDVDENRGLREAAPAPLF